MLLRLVGVDLGHALSLPTENPQWHQVAAESIPAAAAALAPRRGENRVFHTYGVQLRSCCDVVEPRLGHKTLKRDNSLFQRIARAQGAPLARGRYGRESMSGYCEDAIEVAPK